MISITGKYANADIFTDQVEDDAIAQITDLCNNVASEGSAIKIMPDVHPGNGCTIGTTMTITDRVVPNLVGVDISCGILCTCLGEVEIDLPRLDHQIKRSIPSGFYSRKTVHSRADNVDLTELRCAEKLTKPIDSARYQLGTLGGGNHFISIEENELGVKYLLIHSGSRNIGKQVAEYYQKLAIDECRKNTDVMRAEIIRTNKENGTPDLIQSQLDAMPRLVEDLAYLHRESQSFHDYLHDMTIMSRYAALNRNIIAEEIIRNTPELTGSTYDWFQTVHNYIDPATMTLRKGAISAQEGEMVTIPMNMRDGSIIAVGKGNPDWNYSAPHGAGRIMGRREAKRILDFETFRQSMQGIYSSSVFPGTIDESPMVYKPMEDILKYIGDTVEIQSIIKPVYNFKAQ